MVVGEEEEEEEDTDPSTAEITTREREGVTVEETPLPPEGATEMEGVTGMVEGMVVETAAETAEVGGTVGEEGTETRPEGGRD
jgi:hypothetical protein